jgi:hypothetical protein
MPVTHEISFIPVPRSLEDVEKRRLNKGTITVLST